MGEENLQKELAERFLKRIFSTDNVEEFKNFKGDKDFLNDLTYELVGKIFENLENKNFTAEKKSADKEKNISETEKAIFAEEKFTDKKKFFNENDKAEILIEA